MDFTCVDFPSQRTVIHMFEALEGVAGGWSKEAPCSIWWYQGHLSGVYSLSFDNSHIHLPPVENASVTTIVL